MRIINIQPNITIKCETIDQRNGFAHKASLMVKGDTLDTETVHYDNRTWERNEYDTVIKRLVDTTKVLNSEEKRMILERIGNPD